MSAATGTVNRPGPRTVEALQFEAVNAAEIYPGEFQALMSSAHGTSASRGRQQRFSGSNFEIPLGFPEDSRRTGNTSSVPLTRGVSDVRNVIRKVPVTGLAGDRTDHGQIVFMSDGSTWTLTRPTPGLPCGIVIEYVDSTYAWVMFWSFQVSVALALAGSGKQDVLVGIATAGAATGNVATGVVLQGHGKIKACYGIVIVDATDADVVQTLNLEIGGTDVTGGVITWAFGDTVGTKDAGSAITAANEFHDGDLLDIETAATVAGTTADPGLMAIYAQIEYLPGL